MRLKLKRKVAALLAVSMIVSGQPGMFTMTSAAEEKPVQDVESSYEAEEATPGNAQKATPDSADQIEPEDETYEVLYTVDPEEGARVRGDKKVDTGETLEFSVTVEKGYELTEVYVQGSTVEPVSQDGDKYEYQVEDIQAQPDVEVILEEVAYPEFSETQDVGNDVMISLYAEEGVLPEGTTFEAVSLEDADEEMAENAKSQVLEQADAEDEEDPAYGAYQLTLVGKDGEPLSDDQINGDVMVTVNGVNGLMENGEIFDVDEENPIPTDVYRVKAKTTLLDKILPSTGELRVDKVKQENGDEYENDDAAYEMKSAVENIVLMPSAKAAPEFANIQLLVERAGDETVPVKIDGVEDIADAELPVGNIAENAADLAAEQFPGYTFVKATVGTDEINTVGSWNEYVYYTTEGSGDTAMLLGPDETIVLHFEVTREVLSVNYNYDENAIEVEGPEEVRTGDSYTFSAKPVNPKGYQLSVTVNGTDITTQGTLVDAATGEMHYTVENAQSAQNVAIAISPVNYYVFTYNNDNIRQGYITSPDSNTSIEAGKTLEFTLRSYTWSGATDADGHEWHLNLLAINDEYINVPTTFNEGDSAETTLSTGETVTVRLTGKHGILWFNRYHEYTVTVENVYTNIVVTDGNFKNDERNEIILKRLDGVARITGWDYSVEEYIAGNINTVYEQTEKSGNEFYLHLLPGYTNPTITVLANGKETGLQVERNIGPVHGGEDDPSFLYEEYNWRFDIPNDLSDNVEVYVTAEKQYYHIQYFVGGEQSSTITDGNTYTIFEGEGNQAIITSAEPDYDPDTTIFEGWEYNGKLYQPNETFIFDEESIAGADFDGNLRFTAKLTPIEGSNYVGYTVKYYFQQEDGSYGQNLEYYPDQEKYGIVGTKIFWYDAVRDNIDGYVLASDSDVVFMLSEDEAKNVLEIYFDLDKNNDDVADTDQTLTITFDAGEHGSFAEGTQTSFTLKHGEQYPEAPTISVDMDWVFVGWDKEYHAGEPVSIGEGAEAATETYTAQYKEDKNNDGKPDEEQTLTITFDAGEHGSFAEGTQSSFTLKHGDQYPEAPTISVDMDWVFVGWDKEYHAGEPVSIGEDAEAATETYTAQYKEDKNHDGTPDEDQTVTIIFDTADINKGYFGTEEYKQKTTTVGNLLPGSQITTPEGFVDVIGDDQAFDGWFDENGVEVSVVPETNVPLNMTLTAQWALDRNHNNVPDHDEEGEGIYRDVTLQPYATTVYSGGSNNDTTDDANSGFPNLDIQYVEAGRQIHKEAITDIYINDVNVGANVDEVFKAVYWNEDTTTAVENDQTSDIYNVTVVLGEAALGAFAADSGVTARDGYLYDANGQRMPVRNQKVEIVANEEASTARARAVDSGLITYNVEVQDSELTVRPLTDPTHPEETYRSVFTDPSQITTDAGAAAVISGDSEFYTNGNTQRQVDRDGIRLLVDTIQSEDMDREGMLIERANETVGVTDAQNWGYVARYFDLVDVNNGNAWVSSTLGTDVYLPYPEGTDQNTEFTLLHFEGLHREEGLTGESAAEAIEGCVPANMEIENTANGIKFHTTIGGFSPFVLMYRTAEETPDTPDDNDGNHGGNSGSSDSDRNIRTGSSRDSAYIVGVDGHWVHMDPANPNIPITVEVPEGATPVTNPEYHQWKFYLNSGLILWSRWAYVKNPYAVGEQPGEGWFYFDQDGIMQYGWYLDTKDNKWYYLHRTSDGMLGTLIEGWHFDNQDQKWYYLQYGTGEMLTGWQLIDGKWYYFNPVAPTATWNYDEATGGWTYNGSTSRPYGSMYQNEMTPDGYWVDENGAWVQ